ncbi:MAG: mandelate racemase, partial [Pseudomonadota bacterium]
MSDDSAPTILSVSARAVLAPLPRPITTAVARIDQAPLVLVDVQTDRDVVGRSYLFGYTPAALKPMVAAVEAVGGLIEGRAVAPAARMADLSAAFRLLGRQGAMGMAMSGVEMALWDALGRIAGKPVAQLLGG